MVLKIEIDQITRKDWEWTYGDEQWVSMDWVNDGAPITSTLLRKADSKWTYKFNDIMLAKVTLELSYSVKGVSQGDPIFPPEHPRAIRVVLNFLRDILLSGSKESH